MGWCGLCNCKIEAKDFDEHLKSEKHISNLQTNGNTLNPIKIWRFEDSPEKYKKLSISGDEDWLAFVSDLYKKDYLPFLEEGVFGVCGVDEYKVNGGKVYIGYHT